MNNKTMKITNGPAVQQKKIDAVDILPIGAVIGGIYQITDLIGSGAGGVVYKARHLNLMTDVVVKKIKSKKVNPTLIRQEADLLKRLKHPYLPRIYDFVQEKGGIYTVMDFISGRNLLEVVEQNGRINQKLVKKWAMQLGEALAYLHEQKPAIVHSDIKPENIMLTEEGNICLIDFNVSLAMGGEMDPAGLTPGYAPPEMYPNLEMYLQEMQKIQRRKANANRPGMAPMNRPGMAPVVRPQAGPAYMGKTVAGMGEDATIPLGSQETSDIATMLLNAGEQETMLLNAGEQETMLLNAGEQETMLLNAEEQETMSLNAGEQETMLLNVGEQETALLNTGEAATEFLGRNGQSTMPHQMVQRTQAPPFQANPYPGAGIYQGNNGKMPEYVKYIGRGMDERSDIYSLGATLYMLLTGNSLPEYFDKQNPTKELFNYVSEGFLQILTKMLEVNPDKRYKNGRECLKALQNCKKLDHRYVQMRRKQLAMQIASVACISIGILLVAFGIRKNTMEQNNVYYGLLEQAGKQIELMDYAGAIEVLEQARNSSPERIESYETEIFLLYRKGDYEECVTRGKNYINAPLYIVNSESDKVSLGNIYYIVGNAYYELGEYDSAVVLFEAALKENAENALYYRDYAICLAKLGDGEGAKEQLEKGASLGLNKDSMKMAQGEIAFVQNRDEEAIQCFMECIQNSSDAQMRNRAVMACAQVYQRSGAGSIEQEIALYSDYLATYGETGNMVIQEKLAECYTRKAVMENEDSVVWYQKALDIFVRVYNSGYATYQIQENIAILYENMGQFSEAEEILLQLAESYPNRYEVYKRLAYLEADKQQKKAVLNRNYTKMKDYYSQAVSLYEVGTQDMEMDMLNRMIQELMLGGWF